MAAKATCRCGWTHTYKTHATAEYNARRHTCPTNDGVRRATRRYRCARCGLEATYENAGATEARYWFSRHSCRKREEALLRAAIADHREALIDRTPQPCLHKQANHQHGTRACYVLDRCRCHPCAEANATTANERNRLKAYGRYNKYVNAMPVRQHVQTLRDAGMGLKTIALRSGVSHGALWKLVYGKKRALPDGTTDQTPSRRVLRETAEKLYAIDPNWSTTPLPLADGALDHAGTPQARQRLRSLVALGWSMSELARRLGINHPRNGIALFHDGRTLLHATVNAANALFNELCMTVPPEDTKQQKCTATKARNYAREHHWVPPLALDDLDQPISPELSRIA